MKSGPILIRGALGAFIAAALILFVSCGIYGLPPEKTAVDFARNTDENALDIESAALGRREFPSALGNGRILFKDSRTFLWGGESTSSHFDVTGSPLILENLHFGLGREAFPALIAPRFISTSEASPRYRDDSRFILLKMGGRVRAYSVRDMLRHEVVNDTVGGRPIMIAYCTLAGLGAIYERTIEGRVHTFAVSGFTYQEPGVWNGLDGFLLWDRETESLWWPLNGRSVSGMMIGTILPLLDEKYWSHSTWGEIRSKYPEAEILAHDQTFRAPSVWPIRYHQLSDRTEDTPRIPLPWAGNSRAL